MKKPALKVSGNSASRSRARKKRREHRQELLIRVESTKSRDQRKRNNRAFWVKVAAFVILLSGLATGVVLGFRRSHDNPDFMLRDLRISTNGKLSHYDISQAAEIPSEAHLLDLDLEGMDQRLQRLPQVKKAKFRRVFPHTLEIEVDERIPIAWISVPGSKDIPAPRQGGGYFVDSEAVIMTCKALHREYERLPLIYLERDQLSDDMNPSDVVSSTEFKDALDLLRFWPRYVTDPEYAIKDIDIRRVCLFDVSCHSDLKVRMTSDQLPGQLRKMSDVLRHGEITQRRFAELDLTGKHNVAAVAHPEGFEPSWSREGAPVERLSPEEVQDIIRE